MREDGYWSRTIEKQDYELLQLEGTEFDGCTFKDCNFSEARFSRCTFTDCVFEGCNLSLLDIDFSRFCEVEFVDCKMVGINWGRGSWSQVLSSAPIAFYRCILNESTFFGLRLQELALEECKAINVDFREGDFSNARLCGTDFSGAQFFKTTLTAADFTDATDYTIDIFVNEIQRAKFERFEALRLLDCLDVELVD